MRAALLIVAGCSAPTATTPDAVAPIEWPVFTIPVGAHSAVLSDHDYQHPIDGIVSVSGREYDLALDPSAQYVLTMPVEPQDQFDWNKLPGLSDCNQLDLAQDGAMFGWRWNIELAAIEITAYANNAGVHLQTDTLITLDAEDLAAATPLHYRVAREQTAYAFAISGEMRSRAIAATGTLPRRCTEVEIDPLAWAGQFYFGGTSTAPQIVTAKIRE